MTSEIIKCESCKRELNDSWNICPFCSELRKKTCPICMVNTDIKITKCGHEICGDCVSKLEKDECPQCKQELKVIDKTVQPEKHTCKTINRVQLTRHQIRCRGLNEMAYDWNFSPSTPYTIAYAPLEESYDRYTVLAAKPFNGNGFVIFP